MILLPCLTLVVVRPISTFIAILVEPKVNGIGRCSLGFSLPRLSWQLDRRRGRSTSGTTTWTLWGGWCGLECSCRCVAFRPPADLTKTLGVCRICVKRPGGQPKFPTKPGTFSCPWGSKLLCPGLVGLSQNRETLRLNRPTQRSYSFVHGVQATRLRVLIEVAVTTDNIRSLYIYIYIHKCIYIYVCMYIYIYMHADESEQGSHRSDNWRPERYQPSHGGDFGAVENTLWADFARLNGHEDIIL